MRETKNLKLTQFDPNDVPNWLDQYNTDMEKIDSANGSQSATNAEYDARFTTDEESIKNNRTQINENTQDIANIKDDIKNITGGSGTSLKTLQDEITSVGQDITNLKGGSTRTIAELENDINTDGQNINALDGRVDTLEDTTSNIETKIGSTNINDTITHAISELQSRGGLSYETVDINIGTKTVTAGTMVTFENLQLQVKKGAYRLSVGTNIFPVHKRTTGAGSPTLYGILIFDGALSIPDNVTTVTLNKVNFYPMLSGTAQLYVDSASIITRVL